MFSSMSRRRVVVLLVLSCLLLITLDQRGNRYIDKARQGFGVVLRPFDRAAEAAARPFATAWNGITHYSDLQRENRELRDRIEQQAGAEIEYRAAILESQELLKLNRLTSAGNYKKVTARVVGDAPSNFQNTVEINKGSDDGLAVGMPVVDGAGLVGRLTAVTKDRSVVLLITDPSFTVESEVLVSDQEIPPAGADESTTTTAAAAPPASLPWVTAGPSTTVAGFPPVAIPPGPSVPPTTVPPGPGTTAPAGAPPAETTTTTTTTIPPVRRETGLLSGQGSRHPLTLGLVDNSTTGNELRVGAVVKTAGGESSLAPQGIPIGYVTKVANQTGLRTPLIEVTQNAQLDQLYYVNVVLYVPGQAGS
jgi:rod shape-determining protein MreC